MCWETRHQAQPVEIVGKTLPAPIIRMAIIPAPISTGSI